VKKVVLDTNVIISALFWEGNSRKMYDLVRQNDITSQDMFGIATTLISLPRNPKTVPQTGTLVQK